MTVQPSCTTTILTNHFFCLWSLMFVVFVDGLPVIFCGLSLLLRHHAFSLADRPTTGTVGGTRAEKQKDQA